MASASLNLRGTVNTHPPNTFSISTGSSEPIYRQLIEQVRRLIASGHLTTGDVLPSVRDIAQALAINPMTVSKAYAMLEAEGVLERRRGIGMLVAERVAQVGDELARLELLRPTLERARAESRQLHLDTSAVLKYFETLMNQE